jgi:hypothetical protein
VEIAYRVSSGPGDWIVIDALTYINPFTLEPATLNTPIRSYGYWSRGGPYYGYKDISANIYDFRFTLHWIDLVGTNTSQFSFDDAIVRTDTFSRMRDADDISLNQLTASYEFYNVPVTASIAPGINWSFQFGNEIQNQA